MFFNSETWSIKQHVIICSIIIWFFFSDWIVNMNGVIQNVIVFLIIQISCSYAQNTSGKYWYF